MASIVDGIKLPQKLDRRVKLLDSDKIKIREEYALGNTSYNKLAKKYGVSKKLICLVCNAESKRKNDEYIKTHWRDFKGTTEEHTKAIQKTREYKKLLLNKGLIAKEDLCQN